MPALREYLLWSGLPCNGGTVLAVVQRWSQATVTTDVANDDQLVMTLPRDEWDRLVSLGAEPRRGRVLVRVLEDGTETDWIIRDRTARDEAGSAEVTLTAVAPSALLADYPLAEVSGAGLIDEDMGLVDDTLANYVTYILPSLPTWIVAGSFGSTVRRTWSWQRQNGAQWVRAAAQLWGTEWELVRNGRTNYQLSFPVQRGSAASTVDLRTGKNLGGVVLQQLGLDQVTVVQPMGTESARGLADYYCRVTSVAGSVVGLGSWLGDGDDPVPFTDFWKDLYLVDGNNTTFTSWLITASDAVAKTVTVSGTPTGLAVGDPVQFRVASGSSGERLAELAHPAHLATFGRAYQRLERSDLSERSNLVANPFMRTWTTTSAAPDGWTRVAGTGTYSRNTNALYTKRGGASDRWVNAAMAGTTTVWRAPAPVIWPVSGDGNYSAVALLYIADLRTNTVGAVNPFGITLRVTRGAVTATTTLETPAAGATAGWYTVGIADFLPSAAGTVTIEVDVVRGSDSVSGTVDVYLDAVFFGPGSSVPATPPEGPPSTLFAAGVAALQTNADWPQRWEVTARDLERLGVAWADLFVLGGAVRVSSDLLGETTVRCQRVEWRDHAPIETTITLARRDLPLTQTLVEAL